jgi:hypothetical protein
VEVLLALILVAFIAYFVTAPLRDRSASDAAAEPATENPRVADLEARKEAKYREIRDAELDREQGKLSQEDWARADAELRREAIEILRQLDEAEAAGASQNRR